MTILFGVVVVSLLCVATLGLTLVSSYAAEFRPSGDATRRRLAVASWVAVALLLLVIAVRFAVFAG